MQVTEVRIYPADEDLVKAYASISFDNCFLVEGIRVIKRHTGLLVSFPARSKETAPTGIFAFPANAETRRMIQEAILAEYEMVVGGSGPRPSENQKVNSGDR